MLPSWRPVGGMNSECRAIPLKKLPSSWRNTRRKSESLLEFCREHFELFLRFQFLVHEGNNLLPLLLGHRLRKSNAFANSDADTFTNTDAFANFSTFADSGTDRNSIRVSFWERYNLRTHQGNHQKRQANDARGRRSIIY